MLKTILFIASFLLIACNTVSKKDAEKSQLRMQLGVSQLEKQNYPLALKELLAAEELNPNDAVIQSYLGIVYYFLEKFNDSISHYKRAIELDPKYTDAKNSLARVYIEIQKYDLARKMISEVLADLTYPYAHKAYANLGLVEFNSQNYKAAIKNFKLVLQKSREDCLVQTYLGRSYMEIKQLSTAQQQLEKAAEICKQTQQDEGLYYLAISLYRSGEKKQSLLKFKELLSFYPNGRYHEQAKKMIDLVDKGSL